MGMTTVRSGSALSATVTSTVFSVTLAVPVSSLSATVYVALPKLTVTAGTSSSVMLTMLAAGVPPVTSAGRLAPKLSLTLSPSSLTLSASAVKVKVIVVSPLVKVTLAGTPE